MTDKTVPRVRVRLGSSRSYDIEIGAGALERLGEVSRGALSPHARRIVVISNRRVFDLYGADAVRALRSAGFNVAHWLMGDGERHKSLLTAGRSLGFLAETELERSDAVMALGGGVVGDLAGFVAAVYLRGVAFIQVPTTLLAQIDSSVGGKTAVNTPAGKNMIGAFHQPRTVVVDVRTLRTLPAREMTAGWCEAIKQGAVGGLKLFNQTCRFLAAWKRFSGAHHEAKTGADAQVVEVERGLAKLIAAQCAFKARIVAGDEREEEGRTDYRSRRVLNFGHTIGHALESATAYKRFRHGEAVGYGMLAAAEISVRLGLIEASALESLRAAVHLAGRLPRADDLDHESILRLLRLDKKVVGGHVQWVLLERLGGARIVSGSEIPTRVVRDSITAALQSST